MFWLCKQELVAILGRQEVVTSNQCQHFRIWISWRGIHSVHLEQNSKVCQHVLPTLYLTEFVYYGPILGGLGLVQSGPCATLLGPFPGPSTTLSIDVRLRSPWVVARLLYARYLHCSTRPSALPFVFVALGS